MQDARTGALDLLRRWGQVDAARALERCRVVLHHAGSPRGRRAGSPPEADVLLSAPRAVLCGIRHRELPEGAWANEIERTVREALHPRFAIRTMQWSETEPGAGARREGAGAQTAGGRTRG